VHLGIFEELTHAGDVVAPVQGGDDVERGDGAAPIIHDPDGLLGGHPAVLPRPAGHGEAAALGLPEDVVGGAVAARAPAAEPSQPLVDHPRIEILVLPVPDSPPVERSRPVVLGAHVGLGGEPLHDLDRLRLVEVKGHEVFVRVRAEETQPRPLVGHPPGERVEERLVERGGVAHRLASLGELDLDRLGAQLGKVRRDAGAQDVLGRGDDPDPLHDLRLLERILRIEDGPAEILERHVLQGFIDHQITPPFFRLASSSRPRPARRR
jgi:hypothetical protein